ncbi:hypothetical protein [Actinomadura verrucosospora]|uniref:Uncharacterized protein n=1 Tax=Actinomadura verrucosospora TaxID=46165 RepID=A0A7D3VST3_ACTVE|nr:hypothetical protein [Actinomadura verrucosospora]QKG22235.1 hypothetical protein ACTIVE_3873 [Actinomadura verrucosospora]
MPERVAELAARLLAIDWTYEGDELHSRSRIALMREHLHRGERWARHLGVRGSGPFLTLPDLIDPDVRADPDVVRDVLAAVPHIAMAPTSRACAAALHFAALQDAGVPLPALPGPYEPLVLLFERGGGFGIDCSGVFIELGTAAIPRRRRDGKIRNASLAPMDHAALDDLDMRDDAR